MTLRRLWAPPALAAAMVAVAIAGPAGQPAGKLGDVGQKAHALREAATLLEKAQTALANGNKNLAEQLFSTAELLTGPEAVAPIAHVFRAGAPPRITTPLIHVDTSTPPPPKVVGSSDEEDAEAHVAPPHRARASLSGTVEIGGKPLAGAFGLVTLEPAHGHWKPRAPKHQIMEQRMREFLPHVLAIPVGSTVAFPNFDSVFHNVFSTSPIAPFDLGIYKAGEAREYRFAKEGIVRLGCNLHANMSAYIVVVAAPHYDVTDDAGHFAFRHVVPGRYTLKAWSERSKEPVTQTVTIKPGKNEIDVGVQGDAPKGPSPDKFGGQRG